MDTVCALDLGTGSVRACLVSTDGLIVARRGVRIRARAAEGVAAGLEYEPGELRDAIAAAISAARTDAPAGMRIAAMTAAAMRPSCALLDAAGAALYLGPNRDARGVGEAVELLRRDRDLIHAVTGQLPPILSWSARLRWFAANQPEVLAAASVATSIEGWMLSLFGVEPAMDFSSASANGLFDIAAGGWSDQMLSLVSFPSDRLARVLAAGTVLGPAHGEFARELGLEGVPVCAGAGDTHAALAGSGAWREGETAIIAGTSMPVARVVANPGPRSARLWSSRHLRPGFGVVESNTGESGFVWEWLAETLGVEVFELDDLARAAQPTAVIAHLGTVPQDFADMPLLHSGGFVFGLPPGMFGAGRAGLARAGIEAAAWAAAEALSWVDAETVGIGPVRVCGGMTQSELWLETLAAALGRPILVVAEDSAAIGVAACAAEGSGLVADAGSVLDAAARRGREVHPDDALVAAMSAGLPRWQEIVANLGRGAMRISALLGS
ncbi:MAG: FGGY family carbohydrate kinase [Actinomycetota bacterium]